MLKMPESEPPSPQMWNFPHFFFWRVPLFINQMKLLCWRSIILWRWSRNDAAVIQSLFTVYIVFYKYGTDGIWRKSEKWDKNQMQNFAFCSWRRRNAFSWAERKFSLFSQQPTFVNWKYLSRDLYLKFYSCSKWK